MLRRLHFLKRNEFTLTLTGSLPWIVESVRSFLEYFVKFHEKSQRNFYLLLKLLKEILLNSLKVSTTISPECFSYILRTSKFHLGINPIFIQKAQFFGRISIFQHVFETTQLINYARSFKAAVGKKLQALFCLEISSRMTKSVW